MKKNIIMIYGAIFLVLLLCLLYVAISKSVPTGLVIGTIPEKLACDEDIVITLRSGSWELLENKERKLSLVM